MYLPDITLWLALAFEAHVHHEPAKAWFDALPESDICLFSRLTQQGFLRLATNPKAFGAEAVTLTKAWELYDSLLADPRVSFGQEPADLERIWRDYTRADSFSPKVWSDAYLAAFARTGGHKLITFDKAMSKYADPDCTILS